MGFKDKLFGKRKPQPVEIPAILEPKNPVNYDTVLDWLLGLNDKDYKTMLEIANVYREAAKTTSKLLKVKDVPTTELLPARPTEDEVDAQLDGLLETHPYDLKTALSSDPSPKSKQITVNEE